MCKEKNNTSFNNIKISVALKTDAKVFHFEKQVNNNVFSIITESYGIFICIYYEFFFSSSPSFWQMQNTDK